MVQVIKVKCLNCEKNYNAFLFDDKGYSLSQYPCPACGSIKKGMYKNQTYKLNKMPKDFSSMDKIMMDKVIQNKIIPFDKPLAK